MYHHQIDAYFTYTEDAQITRICHQYISDLFSSHDVEMAVVSSENKVSVDRGSFHNADIIVLIRSVITS